MCKKMYLPGYPVRYMFRLFQIPYLFHASFLAENAKISIPIVVPILLEVASTVVLEDEENKSLPLCEHIVNTIREV